MRGRLIAASVTAGVLAMMAGCADDGAEPGSQEQTQDAAAGENAGEDDATEDEQADGEGHDEHAGPGEGPTAMGTFHNADDQEVGTVELFDVDGMTEIVVRISLLEPGFRGLHVHEIGACEPDSTDPGDPEETGDFMSAGGHLNPDESDHGEHDGDLPPLLVRENGHADLSLVTDRFTVADLLEADGAAFMVHSEPDNFAHIPERYDDADSQTLDTGDAGDRVACAVVQ